MLNAKNAIALVNREETHVRNILAWASGRPKPRRLGILAPRLRSLARM